jgi:polyphosphate kinase 2 (PPK2 family)
VLQDIYYNALDHAIRETKTTTTKWKKNESGKKEKAHLFSLDVLLSVLSAVVFATDCQR